MTQLTIVTTPTNSGDGTPLATAFNYCNSNFNELYARYQVTPPASLTGSTGDVPGMYAVDSTYFYYCFGTYNGTSTIWGQVTQVGNISVSSINNGTSNVKIAGVNGNATTSIGGTSNVVVVATTGQYVTGLVSATGNVRGSYILGNGSQLTGLPATYTDANVVTLLSAFGSNTISTTGNITSESVSATGNVLGGNITTGGQVKATGNIITDQYFVGNFFGNITGNFVVPGSTTQVIFNTSGNADAVAGFTFDTGGPNLLTVLGTISSQGNVQAGNLRTAGRVSATGSIISNAIITGNTIHSTSGNIGVPPGVSTLFLGNANPTTIWIGGDASNVHIANTNSTTRIAGNATVGGQVSATGNIRTSNYLFVGQDINVSGDITATSYTGTSSSLSGNVTGANLRTGGQISATGNVTGNYILGNIAFANGLPNTNTIQNGNSNVLVGTSAGNVSINVHGIAPLVIFTPLGQTTTGIISATGTVTAGNVATGGTVSATGNITGNYILGNGSQLTGLSASYGNSNVTTLLSAFGSNTISTTGNITSDALTVGNITNSNANGVGNIGSVSNYFNTVFAQATSAQYADLAENYLADADYAPGTVVIFGGEQEITVTTEAADERVAGVISTNPAYLMNSGEPGLPVALRGKVPVRLIGPVAKGDSLVTSTTPGVAFSIGRERVYGQAVFAKSLESNNSDGEKVILAVIV
jgi:hypothetical protein